MREGGGRHKHRRRHKGEHTGTGAGPATDTDTETDIGTVKDTITDSDTDTNTTAVRPWTNEQYRSPRQYAVAQTWGIDGTTGSGSPVLREEKM